ncbi:MAG: hypothetical protein R3B13_18660 [Polyangiaceae bacterium]
MRCTGEEELEVRGGQVLCIFAALLSLACGSDAEPEGGRERDLPIVRDDGWPVVEGKVNGRTLRLLIDTGAEQTVISSAWLGLPDQVLTKARPLCLGELCLDGEPIYAWETPFSSVQGEVNGFVGMSTLGRYVVEFKQGKSVRIGDELCAGDEVQLGFTSYGAPTVPATVEALPLDDVVIDSGSLYTLLSQSTSDALAIAGAQQDVCTVNGCSDAVLGQVETYCVGSICENAVKVKFPLFDAVGARWLARRRVAIGADRLVSCH